jgi:hypothetical protein
MKKRLAGEAPTGRTGHSPMFLLDSTLYICSNDKNPPLYETNTQN